MVAKTMSRTPPVPFKHSSATREPYLRRESKAKTRSGLARLSTVMAAWKVRGVGVGEPSEAP
jgi:hypothetical protein